MVLEDLNFDVLLKKCKACEIIHNEVAWRGLALVDLREIEDGVFQEMRTCECGATLGYEHIGALSLHLLANVAQVLLIETERQTETLAVEIKEIEAVSQRIDLQRLFELSTPDLPWFKSPKFCSWCTRAYLSGLPHECEESSGSGISE